MTVLVEKVTSRKFLLIVTGLALLPVFPGLQAAIVSIIGVYVVCESIRDVVQSIVHSRVAVEQAHKDIALIETGEYEGDSSKPRKIVPGTSGE